MRFLPLMTLVALGAAGGSLFHGSSQAADAPAQAVHPKIRAITAFIDIDTKNYPSQLEAAVAFLSRTREAYRASGFTVETIRIATQPFPSYTRSLNHDAAIALLQDIDASSRKLGFTPSIGPAMLHDNDETSAVDLLADILAAPSRLNASLIIADDEGIHWKAVRQAARLIKTVSERSAHGQGNLNFAAIAMLKPYGPFFPGAYHLGGARSFAVGLESADVVADVFAHEHDPNTAEAALLAALTGNLRVVESVATKAAADSGWIYAGIDPTPAPMGEVSIGRAIESFGGGPFGSSGTMTAAAIITRAVRAVPVKRVGYSGLMVPVLEDAILAKRWGQRTYSLDSLLAYSAVCAGGLDTVPLPGDVSMEYLARILGDVATLAHKWQKPLAARLVPIPGKKAGDETDLSDPRMANTILQPLPGVASR
ncbi:MAG: DUF711 family protein [Bryobacteraceae bacterium]